MNLTVQKLLVACVAGVCLGFWSAGAAAQNVMEARIDATPLQYMKAGVVQGCGLRFLIVRLIATGGYQAIDASLNIYSSGSALAKAMVYAFKSDPRVNRTPLPVESFWFKAKGSSATTPLAPAVPGEDGNSRIYATQFARAIEVLSSDNTIQFSLRLKGESSETIFAGVPNIATNDRRQFGECLDELSANLEKADDAEGKK